MPRKSRKVEEVFTPDQLAFLDSLLRQVSPPEKITITDPEKVIAFDPVPKAASAREKLSTTKIPLTLGEVLTIESLLSDYIEHPHAKHVEIARGLDTMFRTFLETQDFEFDPPDEQSSSLPGQV
jgi:hypothetical protein